MRKVSGSKVCVVGGAGFLGSQLVDHLINERGCEVWVVDNLIVGLREFIHPSAHFVYHDITTSEDFLRKVFEEAGIKYVFNYAAEPYIPLSFERPIHVFNVNAFGALKVINAADEAGCEGILQVSSAEIYGESVKLEVAGNMTALDRARGALDYELATGSSGKISEDALVVPHSSYGASKAAIDAMVQVRWRESHTPVIALRQFNCVGPRETHPYVIPEIISQFASNKQRDGMYYRIDLGNNSFRDFQFSGDAVAKACDLLEYGEWGEVYNMGSEDGIRIYDLAKLIGELMGHRKVQVRKDVERIRPWEIWHLQADCSKLNDTIPKREVTPLKVALEKTIKWYKENCYMWAWE